MKVNRGRHTGLGENGCTPSCSLSKKGITHSLFFPLDVSIRMPVYRQTLRVSLPHPFCPPAIGTKGSIPQFGRQASKTNQHLPLGTHRLGVRCMYSARQTQQFHTQHPPSPVHTRVKESSLSAFLLPSPGSVASVGLQNLHDFAVSRIGAVEVLAWHQRQQGEREAEGKRDDVGAPRGNAEIICLQRLQSTYYQSRGIKGIYASKRMLGV